MKHFVGYSKALMKPKSSAGLICQSHTMTSTGREAATISIAAYRIQARRATHYATGEDKNIPETLVLCILKHAKCILFHFNSIGLVAQKHVFSHQLFLLAFVPCLERQD